MKKALKIITFIVAVVYAFDINAKPNNTQRSKRFAIKTSLFDYVPGIKLNTVNYNLGLEFRFAKGKSIAVNAGTIISSASPQGFFVIPSLSTNGYKGEVDIRLYHDIGFEERQLKRLYFGPHFVYKQTETKRGETVLDYIDNNPFPNSQHYKQNIYNVNRKVIALNWKIGWQYISRPGFLMDFSIAFGGAYISSHSPDKLGDNSVNDIPWKKQFDSGSEICPNAKIQFAIGWAF